MVFRTVCLYERLDLREYKSQKHQILWPYTQYTAITSCLFQTLLTPLAPPYFNTNIIPSLIFEIKHAYLLFTVTITIPTISEYLVAVG